MSLYFKFLLIILLLVYVLSPFDFLPDVIPFLGRGDDIFFLLLLIYYLIKGKLPGFFYRQGPGSGYYRTYRRPSDTSGTGKEKADSRSRTGESTAETPHERWDPYKILGVEPSASQEEIQAAYRRAVQKYHPDKVSHLGKEFQELAQKKFIEIQKAYEQLKNQR